MAGAVVVMVTDMDMDMAGVTLAMGMDMGMVMAGVTLVGDIILLITQDTTLLIILDIMSEPLMAKDTLPIRVELMAAMEG